MDIKYNNPKHIVNVTDQVAVINLYSDIGGAINAQEFVNEFTFLDSLGLDLIEVRINSRGGSVFEGMGMWTAIFNAKTETHTINDGIALSMAGVLMQGGSKRKMVDFGRLMLHDPSFSGGGQLSEKDTQLLQQIRDSLMIMLDSHGLKDLETIDKLMSEETWFSAQEALELKLIDEILPTSRKDKDTKNLTVDEIYNLANSNSIETNKNEMKELINHFNLAEDATETDIMNKVAELQDSVKVAEEALEAEKTNHQGTITALDDAEKEIENLTKTVATHVVNTAIKEGKLDESKKEELINNAASDLEGFQTILNSVKEPKVRIMDTIQDAAEDLNTDPRKDWTIIDWQKNDSKGLQTMIRNDWDKYSELYVKQYGAEPRN